MRRWPRVAAVLLAIAVLCGGISEPSSAQGTARSMDLDPSARASSMGAASNAVFWGDDADQWANPALLAYHHGLRYEWGKTRLVPGLAEDVFFESKVLKIGGGGVALWTAGRPFGGLGGLKVDYGQIDLTNSSGIKIGSFSPYEQIESWGWALSAGQLAENAARLLGRALPSLSRYGDVSFGMSVKHVQLNLAPPGYGGSGATTARDLGLLLRLTPIRATLGPEGIAMPIRADASYGWSVLSYDDATILFPGENTPDPVSRHRRHGFASQVSLGLPAAVKRSMERRRLGWLASGFDPIASLGLAADRARISAGDFGSSSYKTSGLGLELTVMNLVALRHGWFRDKTGDIDGSTSGWSAGFHLGDFGGMRYDRASFPQARTLPDLERKAFSLFVDPLAIWSALRPER